jgi:hypothetical protein
MLDGPTREAHGEIMLEIVVGVLVSFVASLVVTDEWLWRKRSEDSVRYVRSMGGRRGKLL